MRKQERRRMPEVRCQSSQGPRQMTAWSVSSFKDSMEITLRFSEYVLGTIRLSVLI